MTQPSVTRESRDPRPFMARNWFAFLPLICSFLGASRGMGADEQGGEVVLIYNTALPESRAVAEHYAIRRGVPTNHWIGVSTTTREVISRSDFESQIQAPLVSELEKRGLLTTRNEILPATEESAGQIVQSLTDASIRYLVVCHGVPLRIAEDPLKREPAALAQLPGPFHRNGAAVDAELTVLPLLLTGVPRTGPLANRWFGATNAEALGPMNGVFVVGRLDGPTPALASSLVDRAIEAEENGLLGRGYFDIRGTTDPAYQPGDRWISNAWAVVSRYGFDTELDTQPGTLARGFPLSHVAIYAGWYDQNASGPFAEPSVEFMPGAVAYHLHSYSAATLRSTNEYWVGPFVARGVTATMGMVDEPYLDGTPDIGLCYGRLLWSGFSWGEAALVSQRLLSWQLTVVGDPLYRPFATNALERAKSLAARGQGRVDWALVTLYNRKREAKKDLPAMIDELAREPRLKFSAILQEKLADWHLEAGHTAKAAEMYSQATRWPVSPQQKKRLLKNAAAAYEAAEVPSEAYASYEKLVELPGPLPDATQVFQRLKALAGELRKTKDVRRWTTKLDQLKAGSP